MVSAKRGNPPLNISLNNVQLCSVQKKFKSFDHLVVSCLIMLYKVGRSLIRIRLFDITNVYRNNFSFVERV